MNLPEENSHPVIGFIRLNKIPLVLAGVSALFVFIAVILIVKSTQTEDTIKFSEDGGGVNITIGLIRVDVEGAVERPGVYSLMVDARIEDAIATAGGLSKNADLEYVAKKINRAARVVDGGKVFILFVNGDDMSHNQSYTTSDSTDSQTSHNLGTVVTTPGTSSQNGAGNTNQNNFESSTENNLISINDATMTQLDSLPGIGLVTAQKIIDNRPYQTLEELVSRKVVGKSVYQKIFDMISL